MITDIFNGMYKAFFADAFANTMEEQGFRFPAGSDIMTYLPAFDNPSEIDLGALEQATKLYRAIEPQLTDEFLDYIEQTLWQDFGHYAAMEAMGHGVGLVDYAYSWDLDEEKMPVVPYMESCQLEQEYDGEDFGLERR